MPEDYKDEWKDWKIEHYPILPEAWKMMPRGDTKAHLKALVGLIKKPMKLFTRAILTAKVNYLLMRYWNTRAIKDR